MEMYVNSTRIMVCSRCGAERIIGTIGKTKKEVAEQQHRFICKACRETRIGK